MINNTPIEKIKAIIKTHGYTGISIKKTGNELYEITHPNKIPEIIKDFIFENYNPVQGGCLNIDGNGDFIEFYEFVPIGVEIYHNTHKENHKLKSFEHF